MTTRIDGEDWTEEATQRLWAWVGATPRLQESYASRQIGEGIVAFLQATGTLHGQVLDYGCGDGSLIERLLEAGVACSGCDASPLAVSRLQQRLEGRRGWQGAFLTSGVGLPFGDDKFDVVTCIETLEHVRSESLQPLLREIKRVLRPNGLLLVTTPFEEDLEVSMHYCPFCDTAFHRWQHLRKVGLNDLESWCEAGGLPVRHSWAVDFRSFQEPICRWSGLRHLSWDIAHQWLNYALVRMLDRWRPRPFPGGREFAIRLSRGTRANACVLASKPDVPTRPIS